MVQKTQKTREQIQEEKYHFPYHYIPYFENGNFYHARVMKQGYKHLNRLVHIINLAREYNPSSLLDVGCGDGRLLYEFSKQYPDIRLEGADVSERALAFARAFNPRITFHQSDISDNLSLGKKYDAVTLVEVLEHIHPEAVPKFLKGIHNLLHDDGVFIITVPSTNVRTGKAHYQHFSADSLRATVASYFSVEYCEYIDKVSVWERVMRTLLTNKWYMMRHRIFTNAAFRLYKKWFFTAEASSGAHLCVVCRPIKQDS